MRLGFKKVIQFFVFYFAFLFLLTGLYVFFDLYNYADSILLSNNIPGIIRVIFGLQVIVIEFGLPVFISYLLINKKFPKIILYILYFLSSLPYLYVLNILIALIFNIRIF